jgi:hypothetical protein
MLKYQKTPRKLKLEESSPDMLFGYFKMLLKFYKYTCKDPVPSRLGCMG